MSAQVSKQFAEDGFHEMQVKPGSWYAPVQSMRGNIAGIVSNPPYIPHSQMRHLQASPLLNLLRVYPIFLVQIVAPIVQVFKSV